MVSKQELVKKDLAHVIHPFGVMGAEPKFIFTEGEGVYLRDIDGNKYMDMTSGGVHLCNLGHSPKALVDALDEQMHKLAYFSAGAPNVATEQYIEYCTELAEVLPGDLNRVYMTCSGSETTEVSTQIARHYWDSVGQPGKYKIIAINRAYHGGTLLSRSLTGSQVGMGSFGRRVPEVVRAPNYMCPRCAFGLTYPDCDMACAKFLESVIEQEGEDTISCMIAEVALGNGGVYWAPDGWWQKVREITKEHNILLIADEVQTGFCRSGKFWGVDHFNVVPDMLNMGKGINSGFLPCGAVGVSDKIVNAFPKGQPFKGYVTQDANALVVASARAALKAYKGGMADRTAKLGAHLSKRFADEFQPLPCVDDISGLGKGLYQSFAIKLNKTTGKPYDVAATAKARDFLAGEALKQGVLLGTCDGYPRREPIVPPFIITEAELDQALDVTLSLMKEIKPV
ncbi:MAG: aspartate aminotransferase family protein [Chloroflexi bacterium]|nr:aspartate aminotransferase family protein [Chloroflexota bacterium]